MTFDIHAAIAELDAKEHKFDNVFDAIVGRNPELGGVVAELASILADWDQYGNPGLLHNDLKDAQADAKHLYDLVDELEDRCAQMRDMAITLTRMDIVRNSTLLPMITDLSNKADDAREYAARHKELVEGGYE